MGVSDVSLLERDVIVEAKTHRVCTLHQTIIAWCSPGLAGRGLTVNLINCSRILTILGKTGLLLKSRLDVLLYPLQTKY